MTSDDLAIIVRGITPVLRERTATLWRQFDERLKTIEAREAVPGPPGPAGEPGAPGEPGVDGTVPMETLAAVVTEAIAPITERMTALEQREMPPGQDGAPGRDGKDADMAMILETHVALAAVREDVAMLKALREPQLTLDELERQAAVCCEKALSVTARVPDPVRVQKRVIRDGEGRVDRIVQEAVT